MKFSGVDIEQDDFDFGKSLDEYKPKILKAYREQRYQDCLMLQAELAEKANQYMDSVLINCEDEKLHSFRLYLITWYSTIMDYTKIAEIKK